MQFTSDAFTSLLRTAGVQISMDGRGRALDNVFVERLWRSVKYEEVYLKDYGSVPEARAGLMQFVQRATTAVHPDDPSIVSDGDCAGTWTSRSTG